PEYRARDAGVLPGGASAMKRRQDLARLLEGAAGMIRLARRGRSPDGLQDRLTRPRGANALDTQLRALQLPRREAADMQVKGHRIVHGPEYQLNFHLPLRNGLPADLADRPLPGPAGRNSQRLARDSRAQERLARFPTQLRLVGHPVPPLRPAPAGAPA